MPGRSRTLKVEILGDARNLRRAFGEAHDSARRFGSGVSKVALGVGSALAGVGAVVGAGAFLRGAIDEAREAAKVGRQTNAVIKSTGGVAHVTASQVGRLATAISNTVGVDDELIQSGENWLLTFKNVRDEAGKNNDVFNRTSRAAVDLAASMHQGAVSAEGLHSANTLLGKALNDPLKGLTALAKAGVTFTEGQKKQIKTLVEHNDRLGAQKIILGEVESQVKGFAAASTDQWGRLGVVWKNVQEAFGTTLLPVFNDTLKWIADRLPAAFAGLGNLGRDLGPAFRGIVAGIQDTLDRWRPDLAKLQANLQARFDRLRVGLAQFGRDLVAEIGALAQPVIDAFAKAMRTGNWAGFGSALGDAFSRIVGDGSKLIGGVDWLKVGKTIGRTAFPLAIGFTATLADGLIDAAREHPLDTVLFLASFLAIGKLGQGIARVLEHLPFGSIFAPLFKGLHALTEPLNRAVGGLVKVIGGGFADGLGREFPRLAKLLDRLFSGNILKTIAAQFGRMRDAGARLIRGLVAGIVQEFGLVVKNVGQLITFLTRPFRAAGSWLVGRGRELVAGLGRGITSLYGSVNAWAAGIIARVTTPFRTAGSWLYNRGRDLLSGLAAGIRAGLAGIGAVLASLKNAIVNGIKRLFGIKSPSKVMAGLGANMVAGLVRGLINSAPALTAIIRSIGLDALAAASGIFNLIGSTGPGATAGGRGGVVELGRRMAAGRGWTGRQWNALYQLVQHESGWNPNAQNPTSTAYGLFQFLDSTWASVGARKTSSPVGQIVAGLKYIAQRYGSPVGAWNFWQGHHWYDKGGWLPPGVSLAVNNTGRPERVLPPGGGGTVVNINVQVPPTANPADVGAEVVKSLRAYGKRNGNHALLGITR